MDEGNRTLYRSNEITTESSNLPFSVDLRTRTRLKVFVALYHDYGLPQGDNLMAVQLGLSDLKLN